jgi:hypothetical protein
MSTISKFDVSLQSHDDKREGRRSWEVKNMNKTIKTITIAITVIAFLMSFAIIPANACTVTSTRPKYDLTGVWTFNDAGYLHVMVIFNSFKSTGAFSGIGYYLGGQIAWTITGSEIGNTINFVLTVTSPPADNGITLTGTGTVTSSTSMSGTGYQTNYGNLVWSATKATQVIDVSWAVTNEEDASMGSWYWAMDYFMVNLNVWQLSDGSYFVQKTYDGMSVVPNGAHSPVAGTLEAKDGVCDFDACYMATFTGTLAPTTFANGATLKTKGFLGISNEKGTVSDIIASYPSGTAGSNPNYWSWFSHYFTGSSGLNYQSDSWTYKLCGDKSATARSLVETGIYSTTLPTVVGDIVT